MSKLHLCPHHCPGGSAGAGVLSAVAIGAGAALISANAGAITDALMIILACLAVVSAAGIALLILLVRQRERGPDLPELPYARSRVRVVESQAPAALTRQRAALPRAARALPAGQRVGCPACGSVAGHRSGCRFGSPVAVRRPF